MVIKELYKQNEITEKAKALFKEERSLMRLDGWLIARETAYLHSEEFASLDKEMRAAKELEAIIERLPLSISDNAVFAGTQRDAFARSYALINPSFRVETFSGYCDPTAVYNDIEPNEEFPKERIDAVREFTKKTDYVRTLMEMYNKYEDYTGEVAFFIEQVTGHLIPDFRPVLKYGLDKIIADIREKLSAETSNKKKTNYEAFIITLESTKRLAERYAEIAESKMADADEERKAQFSLLASTLRKVPAKGAESLYEAIQSFILLWQVMCLEQAPNPFAFSVGNADRIFEPYRQMSGEDRETTASLLKHFLVFFNVADRSWAISQSVLVGGKANDGTDLTNETSFALMDAYYDMNLPQPILSAKLHKNTPKEMYREMGKFFFTPGVLTPSLFNDDALFAVLKNAGKDAEDLEDYSVAGCQEPLIMGKDNGNTTNSWFNLPKILELVLNNGCSTITGKKIDTVTTETDAKKLLQNIREEFYKNADYFADKMCDAANGASIAISELPVPFLSVFMGGIETGIDMRDTKEQGTKYNGSGCLIHGLSIIADSFVAIDCFLKDYPDDAERLLNALRNNFEGEEELREYLSSCPKFGNNNVVVDREAAEIASKISDMIASKKNYLGNPFRPDWSSPSTHLTYGYWVGATPDGRKAREQLGYGVDPLYGEAGSGLGFRMLSTFKLPFEKFCGGYASHFGVDPKFFTGKEYEDKGAEFGERVIAPLFFNDLNEDIAPFYLYVNVTTPETLRKVLADPQKYAPSGVYIMRIHGTFVNFLDLSPAIQQDIIKRLDLESTRL